MDHLLRPRNSVFPPVEIPYLDNEDYDGNDYETYAERRGWGPRTPGDWYLIFENPDVQFQAFLQTWLFFGLIYKTLGTENIQLSQLVKSVGNPPRTVQTGSTMVALTGHRYTTEEDVPGGRRSDEGRKPRFTNFGQGNYTVR